MRLDPRSAFEGWLQVEAELDDSEVRPVEAAME
jgi:hypothetical protein